MSGERIPVGVRVRATKTDPAGPADVDQWGEIVGSEDVEVEHWAGFSIPTPVIRLDDGRDWRGYECFWTEDAG